jgi:hypothetical protein
VPTTTAHEVDGVQRFFVHYIENSQGRHFFHPPEMENFVEVRAFTKTCKGKNSE